LIGADATAVGGQLFAVQVSAQGWMLSIPGPKLPGTDDDLAELKRQRDEAQRQAQPSPEAVKRDLEALEALIARALGRQAGEAARGEVEGEDGGRVH